MTNSTKTAPTRQIYTFGDLYIDGVWRPGRAKTSRQITDPYSGTTLAEISQADQTDLEEAFIAARDAQRSWANSLPAERSSVLKQAMRIMEGREEEIVSWLIRESGSTRMKAKLEWKAVHSIISDAANLPYLVEGR